MRSYQHFTLTERESLAKLYAEGKSCGEIANSLGRSKSSISREISRNKNKNGSYHPWRATVLYIVRRKICKRKPRLSDEAALSFVKAALNKYWSPETISQRWRMEHPGIPLSHATIYRALKRGGIEGCSPKTHLRRRGKRKNLRGYSIHPEHTIHDRPSIIEERARLGDLEGDTVYGGIGKGCAVTLVDRASRFLYAALANSRETKVINEAFEKALGQSLVHSITLDNGSEFAGYHDIQASHKTTVYFADPHSPWQRGTNENTNGILRFFFPKGTDFKAVSEEDFQNVVTLVNERPRKCLGWLSPAEFISAKCCT